MRDIPWKGIALVALGTILVLWSTRGVVTGAGELGLVLGIALMASSSAPEIARAKRERAAMAERLDALEQRSAGPTL